MAAPIYRENGRIIINPEYSDMIQGLYADLYNKNISGPEAGHYTHIVNQFHAVYSNVLHGIPTDVDLSRINSLIYNPAADARPAADAGQSSWPAAGAPKQVNTQNIQTVFPRSAWEGYLSPDSDDLIGYTLNSDYVSQWLGSDADRFHAAQNYKLFTGTDINDANALTALDVKGLIDARAPMPDKDSIFARTVFDAMFAEQDGVSALVPFVAPSAIDPRIHSGFEYYTSEGFVSVDFLADKILEAYKSGNIAITVKEGTDWDSIKEKLLREVLVEDVNRLNDFKSNAV